MQKKESMNLKTVHLKLMELKSKRKKEKKLRGSISAKEYETVGSICIMAVPESEVRKEGM